MDHLWATLLPAQEWLTCAGRLAYPIFAFMAVEGYFHTRSFQKYALRMLVFAVLSEVPFNLMCGGTWFYPVHQNVIWTLLMGLLGVHLLETVRRNQNPALFAAAAVGVILAGRCWDPLHGRLLRCRRADGACFLLFPVGRAMVGGLAGQLARAVLAQCRDAGRLMYPVQLFGASFEICQQGFALLALVPIWLYRGRQGYHSRWFQYFCYAFYPVHMLVLALALQFLNR